MRPHRKFLLALTILLAGGSLGLTAAYGFRLRSRSYRHEVERELSAFFELPCEVARIRGRTFSSRAFEGVKIYLHDRRDQVFSCRTAVWHELEQQGKPVNRLDLLNGVLILGSDQWDRSDYRQLLQSSLGHDFAELNLSQVLMSNFEIAFDRGNLSIRCRQASGTIDMSQSDLGIARLSAYELNGQPVDEGVRIHARFSPKSGIEVSELNLSLPEVPLASIGVGPALGGEITQGRFAGRVQYLDQATSDEPEVLIEGELADADLSELTRGVHLGPIQGRFSVVVDQARLYRSVVTHFRGRGDITDFSFNAFAPLLERSSLSGSASFHVDEVDLALGRINRLRLEGIVRDLSLQEWLQRWGHGSAQGQLAVRVNNLDVVGETIKSADVVITAVPPENKPGTIDRTLLVGVAEKVLNFSWPQSLPKGILPKQVEYTKFGLRLHVQDNRLRILGNHGTDNDTILTVKAPAGLRRLLGDSIGLVKEPSGTIDLGPHLANLLRQIRTYDPDHVRQWWESQQHDDNVP